MSACVCSLPPGAPAPAVLPAFPLFTSCTSSEPRHKQCDCAFYYRLTRLQPLPVKWALLLFSLYTRKLRKEGERLWEDLRRVHLDTRALGMSLFTARLTLPLRPRGALHWETLPQCLRFFSTTRIYVAVHMTSTGHGVAWAPSGFSRANVGQRVSFQGPPGSLVFPAQPSPCSLPPGARYQPPTEALLQRAFVSSTRFLSTTLSDRHYYFPSERPEEPGLSQDQNPALPRTPLPTAHCPAPSLLPLIF